MAAAQRAVPYRGGAPNRALAAVRGPVEELQRLDAGADALGHHVGPVVGGVGQDHINFAVEHDQDFFLDVAVRWVRTLLVFQRRSVTGQALDVGGRETARSAGGRMLRRGVSR